MEDPMQHRRRFGFEDNEHLYLFAHNPLKLSMPSFDSAIFELLCKDPLAKVIMKHSQKHGNRERMEILVRLYPGIYRPI
jgi:hypothetical protein